MGTKPAHYYETEIFRTIARFVSEHLGRLWRDGADL
jgi:hypothetical protein